MTTFVGPEVNAYQCIVVAKALRFYAKTRMQVNRAYTPKNMMLTAEKLTGQKFKARDYLGAAAALEAMTQ